MGAVVLFGGLLVITTKSMFLLLLVFNWQVFMMLRRWWSRGLVLGGLYTTVAAAVLYHFGPTSDGVATLAVGVLMPLVIAVVIGVFLTGIIRQSRTRAELIEQLTQARAELDRERHAAGVNAERARLSAEIHDTLAQGFASVLMLTQSTRAVLETNPERAIDQFDLIERTARENLAEARSLVAALCPPDLAGRTLSDALVRLAERHTRDTGVPVTVDVDVERGVAAPEADTVLLRAAQEALSNVRRHAAASTVHITLSRDAVVVTDDGCGFDPGQISGGYGLSGLRRRVLSLGGTCDVRSTPGGGTSIGVAVPT
jgi:signal transduction histidine kinase